MDAVAPVATSPFAGRRARLAAVMGPRAAFVAFSPPERLRNGDAAYKFRQDSDILYLTGFAEPETVVVFRPFAEPKLVLFVRPRSKEDELWNGRRAGVEGAVSTWGADAAFPVADLPTKLPELLSGCDEVHYAYGANPAADERFMAAIARLRAGERRGLSAPARLVDPRASLHELRLRKAPDEIALLRRAAAITGEAHAAAMRAARPGVYEHEIEALIEYTFRRRGGSGPGYGSIVGAGVNATILHYVDNNARLEAGSLLLIDAGCEVEGFTADVTRTFPVGGRFTPAQRRLYEAVLSVQVAAIEQVKPGATIDGIHDFVVTRLTAAMVDLGLLIGDVATLVKENKHRAHYMHRTSHWLGLDVHDVGLYKAQDASRALEPGMVLTIEPGLYVAEDARDAPAEYRGLGVRIEDDILVTPTGAENLTASIAKTVSEIEALTTVAPPR